MFFAFLTKDKLVSLEDIINVSAKDENARILKNLSLNVEVLNCINSYMEKVALNHLDYKIQNLNSLANDTSITPLERANVALKQFGRLSESEVVTPSFICDSMVNLISDKTLLGAVENKKYILDINSKLAEFPITIYKRFTENLKVSPDKIADLIYAVPSSTHTYEFTRKIYEILGLNIDNIAKKFVSYDLLKVKDKNGKVDYEKIKDILNQNKKFSQIELTDQVVLGDKNMKFDVVMGNPPYQETVKPATEGNNKNAVDIYQHFQEIALKLSDITCLIYPAKNIQRGKKDILDKKLVYLRIYNGSSRNGEKHIPNEDSVFGDAVRRIPGDVGVFYYNKKEPQEKIIYQDMEIERTDKILPIIKEFLMIAEKLANYTKSFSFSKIRKVCESNFVQYHNSSILKTNVDREKPSPDGYSKVLTNDKAGSGGKSKWYYIKTSELDRPPVNKFKLILSSARPNESFVDSSNMEILMQDESFGRTKLCIYDSDSLEKVECCKKYLSTKFAKIINLMTPDAFLYYLPDFDTIYEKIEWNSDMDKIDEQLFKLFNFDEKDIEIIKTYNL